VVVELRALLYQRELLRPVLRVDIFVFVPNATTSVASGVRSGNFSSPLQFFYVQLVKFLHLFV
jgi:hypothetical protein